MTPELKSAAEITIKELFVRNLMSTQSEKENLFLKIYCSHSIIGRPQIWIYQLPRLYLRNQ
jgi:hypothetical protein